MGPKMIIPGLKADLHVHTAESGRIVSHNLAERFGTQECYTTPDDVYRRAKEEVDLLAITNHNSIGDALRLADKHPEDVIVGCEYTVKGSDEGHLLEVVVLDLDRKIHEELLKLKEENLIGFIDLIKKEKKPYFMAHPGWKVNRAENSPPLTPKIIDEWLQYFSTIETLNGTLQRENEFAQILSALYGKVGVGGSDSHTLDGLGLTWTVSDKATNKQEFLNDILNGDVYHGGQGGHFSKFKKTVHDLTISFYKDEIRKIKAAGFINFFKHFKFSDFKKYCVLTFGFPLITILPHIETRHYQATQEKELVKFERDYFAYKFTELRNEIKNLDSASAPVRHREGLEKLLRAKKLMKSTRYYVRDLGPIEQLLNRMLRNRMHISEGGFFRNIIETDQEEL
ncbi:PHP domain-containing protein [Candidatus Woesearchaeota archaeon]|nr:PHP domain-containing protein [Candidatus Woesearchaeota archaeon]